MPIPFLSREWPYLAIVDWCLIASKEVSIGEYVRHTIMVDHFFNCANVIPMTHSSIDTSCEAIKHQSTIARFGDSLDRKGIPDPFGAGAYNLQSIGALRLKDLAGTRLCRLRHVIPFNSWLCRVRQCKRRV